VSQVNCQEEAGISEQNESLVRDAYEAYSRGDKATMLDIIDPGLEWTYLDPSLEDPEPQTCHGREQLQLALEGQAERGLHSHVEEIAACGDKVLVIARTPGIDRQRVRQADDRNFHVLALRHGRVIAMRECRDRTEAQDFAGLS
jgi:ketosteroid isomerase-like protein